MQTFQFHQDDAVLSENRPIMERLRQETRVMHNAAEDQSFMRDLMAGTLSREEFAASLPPLKAVRDRLEQRLLAHADHPAIAACFKPHHVTAHLYDADIRFFGVEEAAHGVPAVEEFRRLVADAEAADPVLLLGVFYVLEGSNMGAAILRRKVQEAFGLTGDEGTAAMNPHGSELAARWREFVAAMNALPLTGEQQARMIEFASNTFRVIGNVYRELPRMV